ncbi:MAG TPA: GAF domain-containing protein, partial [Anaerolineales bacterium]|nr:GAF domain-containing protein [Anaerolineales bacterium]
MPEIHTPSHSPAHANVKTLPNAPIPSAAHLDGQPPILVGAALAQSESWMRASLDALEDGYAIFSSIRDSRGQIEDFRYEYINEAGCRLNQRKREEQLGRSLLELLPAHKEQGLLEIYARVVDNGEAFIQQNLQYEDVFGGGKALARAFDVRVMKLGDGIVAQWRDVTSATKQANSEVEQKIVAETFRDISTILNGTLQCEEVLDHILTQVRRVVPYDTANLMLVTAGVASVARYQGYKERGLAGPSNAHRLVVAETGNLAWMAESGQAKAIPDTWDSPEWVKLPGSDWIRSSAGAPLKVKGKTIGFLNVNSATPGLYSQELAKRLLAFAMQAALAIENARLFEEVQRFAYQTSLLHDITHAAVSEPGSLVLLQRLADRLGELLHADGACILLWDETGERITESGAYGRMRKANLDRASQPGAPGIIDLVHTQGKLIIIDNCDHSQILQLECVEGIPGKAFLGLPVMADDRQLGVAFICFLQPHNFTPEETSAVRQAVDQIALAIAKDQLWERERQRTAQLGRANSLIMALGHVAAQIETTSEPLDVMSCVGEELHKLGLECLIALLAEDTQQLSLRYISLPSKKLALAEKIGGIKKDAYLVSPDRFPFFHTVIEGKQPVFSADHIKMITSSLPELSGPFLNRLIKTIGVSAKTKTLFLPLIAKEKVIGTFWLWGDNLEESYLQAASIFAS